jgi:hypothetical protein
MSEPENFLTRWSRRKRVTEEPDPPASAAEVGKPVAEGAPADKPKGQSAPVEPAPVFDPASLPSLESIGAQTDISAFLKPGVPGELRLAALRRAWTADPAIRDFKGLAENDWDFTKPNSMIGFGELDPGLDVKKMLADMFGETPAAEQSATANSVPAVQPTPPSHELSSSADRQAIESASEPADDSGIAEPSRTAATETGAMLHREENIATQNDGVESGDAQIKRRRSQGGALPQ